MNKPNMEHCQFENTVKAIRQCLDTLDSACWDLTDLIGKASSTEEANAIIEFVQECQQVANSIDID